MNSYQIALLIVFAVMTVVGLLSMIIDKHRAMRGSWRISESALFVIAVLLGGVGSTIAMFAVRHKTQHWYFRVFFPIIALLQIIAVVYGMIKLA